MANELAITAVTCVKNEGPFLLEWIAFHQCIGVTDFLFYSNDCDDGTDTLLDALAALGHVTHLPNPAEGRNYQMEALKDAKKRDVVRDADWVWIADVDEFPNIHVGDHSFCALIEACDDPQAISLNFQFFANDDVEQFEDRPVIEQFTRSHNPDMWCGEAAIEVKSLVRQDFPLQYYGAHRPFFKPKIKKNQRPRWTDGAGRAVQHRFLVAANPRRIRRFPAAGARAFATLNHYALRSLDSYLVKNDRGDVNRENRAFDDTYWRERNDPAWEDTSIHRYLPALRKQIDALKAQGEIAALHDACVAAHIARRDALLEQKEYREMQKQLRAASKLPRRKKRCCAIWACWRACSEQLQSGQSGPAQDRYDIAGPRAKIAGYRVADHRIRPRQTDTTSLKDAFVADLLYQGYFQSGDPAGLFEDFTALTELSCLRKGKSLWPQMDFALIDAIRTHHPDVRFLASRRDSWEVSQSMLAWSDLGTDRLPASDIPGLPEGYGETSRERIQWIDGHYAHLRAIFAGDPAFLEYSVADAGSHTAVAAHLGVDLPWWGQANANADHKAS